MVREKTDLLGRELTVGNTLKSRPFNVPESLLFLWRVSIRLKHPSDALQILHCNLHKLDEKS